MRRMVMLLGALIVLAALNSAAALEVRFYPSKQLHAYELDPTHSLRSVVLQNVAIINDADTEMTLSQVELELTAGSIVHETRIVHAADLDRMAAEASQLQSSGMLKALTFQFGGARLLPEGVVLATARILKPGEAMLLIQQMLTFSGKRDALRVRVQTPAGRSEAAIPISTEASRTLFQLPLQGMWLDAAGPSPHAHHRWAVPQEFAHDFMRIGNNGLSYRGRGTRFSDYYAYAQPVSAAAAGQISAVLSDEPEDVSLLQGPGESLENYLQRIRARQNEQLVRGARGIVGNHVLIKHGDEYSLYAHLKPGSVTVKPGDIVTKGQQIGLVGSSGSSTEPHLHFHVCDAPDVLVCAGIPVRFEDVEIYGALQVRQLQSGDLVRNRSKDSK